MFAGRSRSGANERKPIKAIDSRMLACGTAQLRSEGKGGEGHDPPRRYQLLRSSRLSAMLTPEFAMPIGRAMKSMNFVMSTEGWREA